MRAVPVPAQHAADGEAADARELQEFCRGQIASYKIPRYLRFTSEFPTTVTGKVHTTICRGQVVYRDGAIVGDRGFGRFLTCAPFDSQAIPL